MDKRTDAQIYIYAHKPVPYGIWDNSLYTPLQVGDGERFLDLRDSDAADNIAPANPIFAEATGLYFLWKNHPRDLKYIGVCQYRRRLSFPEYFIFDEVFKEYDAIAAEPIRLPGVRRQYADCHSGKDMMVLEETIRQICPSYSADFDNYINRGTTLYYSNGMVMRASDFDKYCEWLFRILFKFIENNGWVSMNEVENSVWYEIHNGHRNGARGLRYQEQICGFLSERLLTLWLLHNCKVLEVPYKKYENLII